MCKDAYCVNHKWRSFSSSYIEFLLAKSEYPSVILVYFLDVLILARVVCFIRLENHCLVGYPKMFLKIKLLCYKNGWIRKK